MIPEKPKKRRKFLTLGELLVIIAIVGIMAGLLLPTNIPHHRPARISQCKIEMMNLIAAISQYETEYGRLPISEHATNNLNFTFGTFDTSVTAFGITNSSGYQANNSEVMTIIMDLDKFPEGKPTVNARHLLNPRKLVFVNAKMAADTNSHGVGPDYVYRDPWGNPYIITVNLNNSNRCRDAFYKLASVSENGVSGQGLLGLARPTPPPYNSSELRDSFELPGGSVMIWSLGPDGKADKNQKANEGVNKDNVTSW